MQTSDTLDWFSNYWTGPTSTVNPTMAAVLVEASVF